jgi:PPM family protein phosphatase
MSLILRAAAVSDLGLARSNNEDAAHAGLRLLAVADGIGGMPAGELASDIVIRALARLDKAPDPGDPVATLRTAVDAANLKIRESADSDPTHDGMGTTVTALLLSGDQIGLLHVGDSRAYLWRDRALTQLTRDDTFVQGLVDQGVLTSAEARSHPRRSLVTQAVQGHDYQPSSRLIVPKVNDRFLLCSDGLSDVVTDDAIAEALGSYRDPKRCSQRLVDLALRAGAPDNVTAVIGDITAA